MRSVIEKKLLIKFWSVDSCLIRFTSNVTSEFLKNQKIVKRKNKKLVFYLNVAAVHFILST